MVSGSAVDWVYDTLGVKYAFTLELRDKDIFNVTIGTFELPPDQIKPTCEETWIGIESVLDVIHSLKVTTEGTTVTTTTTTEGTTATTTVTTQSTTVTTPVSTEKYTPKVNTESKPENKANSYRYQSYFVMIAIIISLLVFY